MSRLLERCRNLLTIARAGARPAPRGRASGKLDGSRTAVESAVRHYRDATAAFAVLTVLIGGVASGLLYYLSVPPPRHGSFTGWWAWVQRAGHSWDPVSTLGLLSGVTLTLMMTIFIARIVQGRSGRVESPPIESGPPRDDDVAATVAIENLTLVVCVAAAAVSWMLAPVAASAPTSGALHAIAPIVLGFVFSGLAAIAQPSDEARSYYEGRSAKRQADLTTLRANLADRLQPSRSGPAFGIPLGERDAGADRSWRWLLAIGGSLGLAAWLCLVIRDLADDAVGWRLPVAVVVFVIFDGGFLTAFVMNRVAARNQRQIYGRWSDVSAVMIMSSLGLMYAVGLVVVAVRGSITVAVLIGLVIFGPVIIFVLLRDSVYITSLQYRDVRRRLYRAERDLRAKKSDAPFAAAPRRSSPPMMASVHRSIRHRSGTARRD